MTLTESLTPDRLRAGGEDDVDYVVVGLRCDAPLALPLRYVVAGADEIALGRGTGEVTTARNGDRLSVAITIDDASVSTRHARLRLQPDAGSWLLEDMGSKNGSAIGGVAVTAPVRVAAPAVIELGRTFVTLVSGPALFAPRSDGLPRGLRTLDPTFEQALERVHAHLTADAPALLLGETGVGKELIARGLHERLGRGGALVAVNCGALPASLVESELFGHRKGAFSGALADRVGYVQSADGGTLFLDEVGDLPLAAQAALLRVLQEREVTPLGATRPVPVDLRVIAATHRDLDAMVRAGQFRSDLLARLTGTVLRVPPLRDRPADFGPLVGGILAQLAGERAANVRIRRDAARALYNHVWPSNVRELVGALRGALAVCGAEPIGLEHLPDAVVRSPGAPRVADTVDAAMAPLEDRRRDELLRLLEQHQGNVAAVARAMNRHRSAIFRWMRELGIDPERYRR